MGIAALERRASPENPSTSLSAPAAWLTEAFGASPTHSGVAVNERTALNYAACYACINVLSKDVAQLPVFVYERKGEERTPAREHDVWRVLHDRPNEYMGPFTFKQVLQAHVVSWGNGYAEIESDNAGRVRALWPLLPDRTRVEVKGGKKWIVTRVKDDRWVGLPSERVLHVMGLGFDGFQGYSVIHMARNAIGAGMAAEEFSSRLFSNGATPRIALKTPKTLSPDARLNLKMSWDAAYAGLSNAHRTAVLEEGLEVEKLGLPAKDQEMIESSKFSIAQMARFFDIPAMRLHSTDAITSWGTGLEQWQRAYLIHTLGPWLVQWEETANWALFTEKERSQYFVEFLREALLQGDMAAQGQYFTQLLGAGAISPNQIARKINMPTVGPEGDQRFIPLNYIPLASAARFTDINPRDPSPQGDEADPDEGDDEPDDEDRSALETRTLRQQRSLTMRQRLQDAYQRIYRQVAERVLAKHVSAARRSVERLDRDGNVDAFRSWAREFFESERSVMQDAYLPTTLALGELVAANVLEEVGSDVNMTQAIERFAVLYVEALAVREAASSIGQLIKITKEGATAEGTVVEKLMTRLAGWEASRSDQIAFRESRQAGNAVARHIYEQAGVQRLAWVATGSETCPLCQFMNGRIASITRPFLGAGESVEGGEQKLTVEGSIAHPPLHKGCDCQIVAA